MAADNLGHMKRWGIGEVGLIGVLKVFAAGLLLGGMALFVPAEHGGIHLDFVTLTVWGLAAACGVGVMILDFRASRK